MIKTFLRNKHIKFSEIQLFKTGTILINNAAYDSSVYIVWFYFT